MNLLQTIKSDAVGVAIIKGWLGDSGITVHPEVAQRRADICRGCPHNKAPNWWGRAKGNIAFAIKSTLEVKNKSLLRVKNEKKLSMCSVCGCCIRLSVWTPIIHIAHHTTPEQLGQYPEFCWKKTEIKEHLT